jgi:hypothetical protein
MVVAGAPAPRGRLCAGVSYAYVPSKNGDDAGDEVGYHAVYDLRFNDAVTFPFEVLGSVTTKEVRDGVTVAASGSHTLALSPAFTFTFANVWTACAGIILPVWESGWGYHVAYEPHLTLFYGF